MAKDALAEDENVIRWKSESISPATAMILETFEREDQEDDVKTRAKYIEMNEKESGYNFIGLRQRS